MGDCAPGNASDWSVDGCVGRVGAEEGPGDGTGAGGTGFCPVRTEPTIAPSARNVELKGISFLSRTTAAAACAHSSPKHHNYGKVAARQAGGLLYNPVRPEPAEHRRPSPASGREPGLPDGAASGDRRCGG